MLRDTFRWDDGQFHRFAVIQWHNLRLYRSICKGTWSDRPRTIFWYWCGGQTASAKSDEKVQPLGFFSQVLTMRVSRFVDVSVCIRCEGSSICKFFYVNWVLIHVNFRSICQDNACVSHASQLFQVVPACLQGALFERFDLSCLQFLVLLSTRSLYGHGAIHFSGPQWQVFYIVFHPCSKYLATMWASV